MAELPKSLFERMATAQRSKDSAPEPDEETKNRNACESCGGTGQAYTGRRCWWCEGRGYRL